MEPSPRSLKFVSNILLPKYGWEHQEAGKKYPKSEKSFRQTINTLSRSDRGFKVVVDRDQEKIMISFDAQTVSPKHKLWLSSVKKRTGLKEFDSQPYWGFNDLYHKAGTKLLNCFYVEAETKKEKGKEFFKYSRIKQLSKFSLGRWIEAIEEGLIYIDFDARTGHNHGTKFRFKQNKLDELYEEVKVLL